MSGIDEAIISIVLPLCIVRLRELVLLRSIDYHLRTGWKTSNQSRSKNNYWLYLSRYRRIKWIPYQPMIETTISGYTVQPLPKFISHYPWHDDHSVNYYQRVQLIPLVPRHHLSMIQWNLSVEPPSDQTIRRNWTSRGEEYVDVIANYGLVKGWLDGKVLLDHW